VCNVCVVVKICNVIIRFPNSDFPASRFPMGVLTPRGSIVYFYKAGSMTRRSCIFNTKDGYWLPIRWHRNSSDSRNVSLSFSLPLSLSLSLCSLPVLSQLFCFVSTIWCHFLQIKRGWLRKFSNSLNFISLFACGNMHAYNFSILM